MFDVRWKLKKLLKDNFAWKRLYLMFLEITEIFKNLYFPPTNGFQLNPSPFPIGFMAGFGPIGEFYSLLLNWRNPWFNTCHVEHGRVGDEGHGYDS